MANKTITVSGNATTGAWLQLDANVQGTVSCAFYNESQKSEIVVNAVDATAAAAEKTANRVFVIPAGGVVTPVRFDLNPSTTWVRSATASATTFQCHMEW